MDNPLFVAVIAAVTGAAATVGIEHIIRAVCRRIARGQERRITVTFDPLLKEKCLSELKHNLFVLGTIKAGMFRGPEGYKNAGPLLAELKTGALRALWENACALSASDTPVKVQDPDTVAAVQQKLEWAVRKIEVFTSAVKLAAEVPVSAPRPTIRFKYLENCLRELTSLLSGKGAHAGTPPAPAGAVTAIAGGP
ncbi:MAG: hypothetical protein LBQ55_10825 [Treponema sp.]|jgi:hypothetical protein|nr:hypothetical protein [Treponema sp.]